MTRDVCREFGFTSIEESRVAPGSFVATHPCTVKVVSDGYAWTVYSLVNAVEARISTNGRGGRASTPLEGRGPDALRKTLRTALSRAAGGR